MSRGPDDPFEDATRHRAIPRPGAGRAGSSDSLGTPTRARAGGPSPPADSAAQSSSANLREFVGAGANRLLGIAIPLVALIGRLRISVSLPNVSRMLQQAIRAVREFESELAKLRYPQELSSDAHYVLCAAIDQAVLSTPWGLRSEWASQGLTVTFHKEALGGKYFFDVLERACSDPARNIDLLELQYICLCLGFAGKFQEDPRGAGRLAELRDDAYRRIRDVRGTPESGLSLRWEGEHDRRHRLVRYAPLWVVAAAASAFILGSFLVFKFALHRIADTVHTELAGLATSHPDYTKTIAPASRQAVTLQQLLSAQQNAGVLSVEETDKGTLVSLIADDLFASGSATLNPRYVELVHQVAEALNQVPGRVVVMGHTDDRPIRTLRFADNVELSRARAVSVKDLLAQPPLAEPARLSWEGLGSSAPKFQPTDSPKNRRIEILLQR